MMTMPCDSPLPDRCIAVRQATARPRPLVSAQAHFQTSHQLQETIRIQSRSKQKSDAVTSFLVLSMDEHSPESTPLAYEIADYPVACATFILCVLRWIWINRSVADRAADSAFSFKAVVSDGEIDRILFAQISHESFVHLALNMSSLISLRDLESSLGSFEYLKLIIILMFLSAFIMLCSSFALYRHTSQLTHLTSSSVGYSCVLFGMTSFQSLSHSTASISIFGLRMPALFSPFASLVMVSILVPTSSFSGHLGGILAGFAAAALSLHRLLPMSFLVTLPLLCLVSKRARSQYAANQEAQLEDWDSV
jgi:membrane associated rhomboid family serine protease